MLPGVGIVLPQVWAASTNFFMLIICSAFLGIWLQRQGISAALMTAQHWSDGVISGPKIWMNLAHFSKMAALVRYEHPVFSIADALIPNTKMLVASTNIAKPKYLIPMLSISLPLARMEVYCTIVVLENSLYRKLVEVKLVCIFIKVTFYLKFFV